MATTGEIKMKYRYLGNTGLKVSELCLGCMNFGWFTAADESFQQLDRFVEAGGNFLDTADAYGNGASEKIVGDWMAKTGNRENMVVATKVYFPTGKGVNDVGLSRKHILQSLEESLKRLQTSYIDLLQIHVWDTGIRDFREVLSTLTDLVHQGKVRYIGISNTTGWQLQKLLDMAHYLNMEPMVCLQAAYNLMKRTIEYELVDVCQDNGVGIICWSPLNGGWLTGKYFRGMEIPKGSRLEWSENANEQETNWSRNNKESTWNIIDRLGEVAKETGKSHAQVALRWLLQKQHVTCPIIGARDLKQLEENLVCLDFKLTDDQMKKLDETSAPEPLYPYSFVNKFNESLGRTRKN